MQQSKRNRSSPVMLYVAGAVTAIVVLGIYVTAWIEQRRAEPPPTSYKSLSMQFYEAKGQADLLYERAKRDGNYDDAIAAYKAALAIRPENAEACNNLGSAYYEKAKRVMAPPVEEDLTVYSSDPKEVLEYMKTKMSTISSGKFVWDVTEPVFKLFEAWAKTQRNVLYYNYRSGRDVGLIIFNGETAEAFRNAEVYFWRAVNLMPDYAPAYRNLGALYVERGRREDAIELFQEYLKLQPQDRDVEQYLQQL